jgi:hypothetical protein
MKAKFVYESIADLLKPKSEEELDSLFIEYTGINFKDYKKLAKELEDLGVEIKELLGKSHQMIIKVYMLFVTIGIFAKHPQKN